ncbi:MAG TPA: crossover junction endodeoxyribonuclease RuvC [Candidatus Baltobacteraceae bacterium]|jgi:crossover junction endodeoxyribonuclease RuvC|nr:crossover junction endodeoxyribonuclease RuvC [Candidatus Baltobacteraceae bacterium]
MIILGIDPGFADMGFGVIEVAGSKDRCIAYGSVKTPAGAPITERLSRIYDELSAIIAKHRPDRAGIEKLYFSNNAKTAMLVAEARGVIRLCLEKHGLSCTEVGPAEVKIAVCGHGAAAKPDVQKMTRVLLGLAEIPKPDDAADALAVAITVAHTRVAVEKKALL